jgi:hypothetical protein
VVRSGEQLSDDDSDSCHWKSWKAGSPLVKPRPKTSIFTGTSNSPRRLLESLGMDRKPRDMGVIDNNSTGIEVLSLLRQQSPRARARAA